MLYKNIHNNLKIKIQDYEVNKLIKYCINTLKNPIYSIIAINPIPLKTQFLTLLKLAHSNILPTTNY
jgi:hypothetical protein